VVKLGPQLVTPAYELKPPYPASKLVTEEEATLRLRLLIDEHGRVFVLDHTADWYLGASVDEALTALVAGRMPARLADDGTWA